MSGCLAEAGSKSSVAPSGPGVTPQKLLKDQLQWECGQWGPPPQACFPGSVGVGQHLEVQFLPVRLSPQSLLCGPPPPTFFKSRLTDMG